MAAVLRKLFPVASPSPKRGGCDSDDGDETSSTIRVDYSFAMEYTGPPIVNVPRAAPVEVDQIPIAQSVSFSSHLNDVPIPIIQPIVRRKKVNKKPYREGKFGSEFNSLSDSVPRPCVVLKGHHVVSGSSSSLSSSPSSSPSSLSPSLVRLDGLGSIPGDMGDHNVSNTTKILGSSHSISTSSSSAKEEIPDFAGGGDNDLVSSSDEPPPILSDLRSSDELGREITSLDRHDEKEGLHVDRNLALSDDSSGEEEEDDQTVNTGHARRVSVTFIEPRVSSVSDEGHDISDAESFPAAPKAERKGKKGTCYRCQTGNRFTEKEICIVCDAKYCSKCVRRVMGAMPEGRKCVSCIGRRIDESKRGRLGKFSRMLKRLLTESEAKQIMIAEISCKTNQLPSQLIAVNSQPLSEEELFMLQTCSHPPKMLKSGNYWYDKVAGLWGKEGEKPCQIISPNLKIGGNIQPNASNGDTEIYINSRKITKTELRLLKVIRVQCEGNPHFWVNADGTYQEEGQNHVKGNIWDKKRARLACTILSLPVPPKFCSIDPDLSSHEQKLVRKLLLFGNEMCGTSTVFKQAKSLYNVPYSKDEREKIKFTIQVNVYSYLAMILEAHEQFEKESSQDTKNNVSSEISGQNRNNTDSSMNQRLKHFSDWLIEQKEQDNLDIFPASSRENVQTVAELWGKAEIQASYKRIRNTLSRNAVYFLERIIDVLIPEYDPSDEDILWAEGLGSSIGLSCVEFSFPTTSHEISLDPDYQHDPNIRYQLIRLHPRSLGDNCKWLDMFEDSDMVIFCIALTDYDEYIRDGDGNLVNKMMAHRQLFETIVTHPSFAEKRIHLFLTKSDLLGQKIDRVPLRICEWFVDFNPLISQSQNSKHNNTMAQWAFHFIAYQFKRLYDSLVGPIDGCSRRGYHRKLFVSQVNCLESDAVDNALRYAREILKWHTEEVSSFQEISTTSLDASLSSS